jgi:predicted esterase
MRTAVPLLFVLFLTANAATAQVERYELGRRLKRFEAAWEEQTDPAARKRALAVVSKASPQFLAFQLAESARTLDEARFALRSAEPPSDAERWAAAVYLAPESRLVDAGKKSISVTLRALYPVRADLPRVPVARIGFARAEPVTVELKSLPVTVELPIPDEVRTRARGDRDLEIAHSISISDRTDEARLMPLSAITNLDRRLSKLRKGVAALPSTGSLEAATLLDRIDLLGRLAGGEVPETDLPAARLFAEAEKLELALRHAKGRDLADGYYGRHRGGECWLSVPTGKDRRTACRLFVPDGLDAKKPVPLVVALHGAGGSENLFFEGYGNGRTVKECAERGWMLLAPRGGGLLGGTPPVAEVVAKLSERYPIDPKRVFLLGHSMGAAQAVELVQQNPGRFAAVACLGGGGRVRKHGAFAELPLFVGVGSKDFALRGAKSLSKALADAGAKRATFKEYPELEHLMIVREALPDVFAIFDGSDR